MNGGATSKAIDAILDALMRHLAENFVSLYLYGSLSSGTYQPGQSDINLIIIVDEEATLHGLRMALRPIWSQYAPVLKRVPLIMTPRTFKRHLRFNPGLARHLSDQGYLIAGQSILSNPQMDDPIEQLSELSRIAMQGSAAITQSLLSERESDKAISCLRSLTRQLFNLEVSEGEKAATLFGHIQADLLGKMEQHPSLLWKDKKIAGAPPLLADLRAIYEYENRLILLLPDLGYEHVAHRITQIDWDAVASRVIGQYRALWITTSAQLRLVLLYDSPASYQLGSYHHAWGLDPISDLKVDSWRVYRNLGRSPSSLLIDTLPHVYIKSEDSDLAMVVHNLQNRLLNIQLTNELFYRVKGRAIPAPPTQLTAPDLPMEERIDGIHEHLDWWAEHYAIEMSLARD